MSEYTVHVQVPDAAIGAVLHDIVLGLPEVTCATLRSGSGTWLSFGLYEYSDDLATTTVSTIRYLVSRTETAALPEGYSQESLLNFETAPMILTCGRTIVHSEGV